MSSAHFSGIPKGKSKRSFLRKQRIEKNQKPKVHENNKRTLIVHGKKTNPVVKSVLGDFYLLKKPDVVKLAKKNDIKPFEDARSLEFFAKKNDGQLFLFGESLKKRPNSIVFGRYFDDQVLDMCEFNVLKYNPLTNQCKDVNQVGSAPCILFQGDGFVNDENMKNVANLFTDWFRGERVPKINLLGLDHVFVCTSLGENKIHLGHYGIKLSRGDGKVPNVNLVDIGPTMELQVTRHQWATEDLLRSAYKIPYELRHSKNRNKNLGFDEVGNAVGRVHMPRQDIREIASRKFKALKKSNIASGQELAESSERTNQLKQSLESSRKRKRED